MGDIFIYIHPKKLQFAAYGQFFLGNKTDNNIISPEICNMQKWKVITSKHFSWSEIFFS